MLHSVGIFFTFSVIHRHTKNLSIMGSKCVNFSIPGRISGEAKIPKNPKDESEFKFLHGSVTGI